MIKNAPKAIKAWLETFPDADHFGGGGGNELRQSSYYYCCWAQRLTICQQGGKSTVALTPFAPLFFGKNYCEMPILTIVFIATIRAFSWPPDNPFQNSLYQKCP